MLLLLYIPAIFYFVCSCITLFIVSYKQFSLLIFTFKLFFLLLWTGLIAYLCFKGYETLSIGIVIVQFLLCFLFYGIYKRKINQ